MFLPLFLRRHATLLLPLIVLLSPSLIPILPTDFQLLCLFNSPHPDTQYAICDDGLPGCSQQAVSTLTTLPDNMFQGSGEVFTTLGESCLSVLVSRGVVGLGGLDYLQRWGWFGA